MDISQAYEIIASMSPCGNCEYKNTGCSRLDDHVWNDGFCILFDEAMGVIKDAFDPTPEPSITDPEDGTENGTEGA